MIIIMKPEATEKQIESVIEKILSMDFDVHRSTGEHRTILGVVGDTLKADVDDFRSLDGVHEVIRVSR